MGEMVEFASNGTTTAGYLATPSGRGPGLVVIQEWWGLVDHIKDLCDRFAAEGFVSLAPDLYHGKAATEPDDAGKYLMSLNIEQAARDMSGAVDFLLAQDAVQPKAVGTTGFCAGGTLSLYLATVKPIKACAPFYPYPFVEYPDLSKVSGAVQFHVGEHDQGPTVKQAQELVDGLQRLGKDAELYEYPGADHAFMNDTRADVYRPDAAAAAWKRMLDFFRKNLT
jgi:carboxymethylenebutenolidase